MNYRKTLFTWASLFVFSLGASQLSYGQCDTIYAGFSSNAPKCTGENVDFLFTQVAYTGLTYSWDFGSGASPATSTAQNPTGIVYSTPGLKLITITVTHPSNPCTVTYTGGININEMPNPSFANIPATCEEADVNFTYTGTSNSGWIYSWDFGTGSNPSVSSAQSPTGIKYSSPGNKTVGLTVTNGACVDTTARVVVISNKPSANFSAVSVSCTDDSINFNNTGSTGLAYNWDFGLNANPSNSSAENPTDVYYSTSGNKSVQLIVTDGACTDTIAQTINVSQTPAPSFGPIAAACEGSEVNFNYNGSTGTGWTYSWDLGSGASPSVSTAQNPLGIMYAGAGTKTATVTVANGMCAASFKDNVVINETPIAGLSSSTPACSNDSVNFSNTGTTGQTYNWTFGSGASPAASTQENPMGIMYSTPGIKSIQQVVTQGACTDTVWGSVSVTETPAPNFNHNAPQCEGAEVNFTYNGSTGVGWTYLWDFGTGASPSLSANSNPAGISYSGSGSKTVTLTVTNQLCSETTTQSFNINFTPQSGFSSNAPGCTGDSVNFQNGGSSGVTYAWDFGSGASPASATSENPAGIIYTTPGIKTVRQIASQGTCRDTSISYINVKETPVPSFTDNGPQCEGDDVNFTYTGSTGSTFNYLWDFGNGASPSTSTAVSPQGVTYTGAGSKNVTLSVSNQGCSDTTLRIATINFVPTASMSTTAPACSGDTVLFNNTGTSGAPTYAWSFAGGSPATSNQENPGAVTFSTDGVKGISLVVATATCSDTAFQNITINETPSINISSTAPACAFDAVSFVNMGSTGSKWNYIWDFGSGSSPSISTSDAPANIKYNAGGMKTISLTVSDAKCSNSDTTQIEVYALPMASAGQDTTICANRCLTLGDTATSGNSYKWFPASTLNSDTLSSPEACPKASINSYMLTVTDGNGCQNHDTITVTMLPSAIAKAGPDVQACEGDSLQIGAALIEGQTYRWSPAAGLSDTAAPSPIASPDSSIIYTLSVSYKGCEVIQDQVVYTVYKNPIVNAGNDVTIAKGSTTQLLATGGIMYEWTPNESLNNGGIYNPLASPEETTTYVVLVTDQNSCQNMDSVTVSIIEAGIWAPTAFTPNGDGANDVFFIRDNGAMRFQLAIFDRNGELIFTTTDSSIGWDGTRQGTGEKLPPGAYVYSTKGDLSDGTSFAESGVINLIR